jgi:hypothetical protein|tara:strand:+ start:1739 stop:1924 length:186 start_codon:yes stop_codon:yes gene_type:complete
MPSEQLKFNIMNDTTVLLDLLGQAYDELAEVCDSIDDKHSRKYTQIRNLMEEINDELYKSL